MLMAWRRGHGEPSALWVQGQKGAAVTHWCWPLKDHPGSSTAGVGGFFCIVLLLEKGDGLLFCVWSRKEKHKEGWERQGREGSKSSGFKKRFRNWAVAWGCQGHGNRQMALGLDASKAMCSLCYREEVI